MKISNLIRIFLMSLCLSVFAYSYSYAGACNSSGTECVSSSGKRVHAIADGDCDAVSQSVRDWQGCIFCKLYRPLFNTAQGVAAASSKTFGTPFANLLAIGMALFIAYETLKMVGSFTQQDIRKYLNTVGIQFFKMMLVFFALKNMTSFYGLLVNPILLAGFDFGSAVADLGIHANTSSLAKVTIIDGGATFSYTIYDAVERFATGCQAKVAEVMAVGKFLMCFSLGHGWKDILPDFGILIQGLITFIVGTVIMVSFGFLLIDAMIQMGIFGALAPFCLAAWPFKITRHYTSSGWKIFSGVFLTYAMAGVTLKIVFELVGAGLQGDRTLDGKTYTNFGQYANALDTVSADTVKSSVDTGFLALLVSVACAVIAFRLTGKISELVGDFGGSKGPGIGSDMGKQAMTAAKRLGTSAAGAAAEGAKAVSDATGLTEAAQKARDAVGTGIKKLAGAPAKGIKSAIKSNTAQALLNDTKGGRAAVKTVKGIKKGWQAVKGFVPELMKKAGEGLETMDKNLANRISGGKGGKTPQGGAAGGGAGGNSSGGNPGGNLAQNTPSGGGTAGSNQSGGSSAPKTPSNGGSSGGSSGGKA